MFYSIRQFSIFLLLVSCLGLFSCSGGNSDVPTGASTSPFQIILSSNSPASG